MYEAADFVEVLRDRALLRSALLAQASWGGEDARRLTQLADRFKPISYDVFQAASARLASIAKEDADTSTSDEEEYENLAEQALVYDDAERAEELAERTSNLPLGVEDED